VKRKTIYEHPELVRLLYFNLKTAYITNNREMLSLYLACIKKAVTPKNSQVVEQALTKNQMKDLNCMVDSVKKGIYYQDLSTPLAAPEGKYIASGDPSDWVEEEKELQQFILDDVTELNRVLGTNLHVYNIEHDTEYGPIDVLAKQERKICVIELKKAVADHKVVGQIQKYIMHFQKRLSWNLWDDDIRGVCIAGDYTEFTYNQLRKMGVTTLTYSKDGDRIRFRVV
jgi:hypothetical protein